MSKTNGTTADTSTNQDGFQGFSSPNYTQVPDELFDELMPQLSDPELRILLYIVRRTFGFKKQSDTISLKQMVEGISTQDGRILDRGAGVGKTAAVGAVKRLVARGVITAQRNQSPQRGYEATTYALRFRETLVRETNKGASSPGEQALVHAANIQETDVQETDLDPSKFERSHDESEQTNDQKSGEGDHLLVARTHQGAPTSHAQEEAEEQGSETRYVPLGELVRLRTQAAASIGAGKTAAANTPTTFESRAPLPAPKKLGRPVGNTEEREQLRAYLSDFARELGDEAPLASTITRTLKIFTAANVPSGRWGDYLYQARAICQERTGQITKQASGPTSVRRKNKMPYFLATLEQQVGLRPMPSGQSGQPVHPR